MKVIGKVQVEIDDKELGSAIWQKLQEMMGEDFDDAGCDWYTSEEGFTYIGDNEWKVSENPIVASLVDSANYLTSGRVNKISGPQGRTWIETI